MRKILVWLTFMLFAFQCNLTEAKEGVNQFGYVNIAEVMQLHPTMRYFDPSSKRFELAAFIKSKDDIEERIEENKVKAREEYNKLEKKLEELENKRKEIEEIYLERVEHLGTAEDIKKMSEKDRKKYEKKKAELDSHFYNEADEIRKKIYYAKQDIKKQENNSNFTGYLTVGETSKVFSLMLDDVYEAINAVSKKKNISFVFNSSANIEFDENPLSVTNRMGEFFDNFKETLNDPDGKVIAGGALTQWLSVKNSTFTNCLDRRINSFVLVGGADLTGDVIDYIYVKYKIGLEQREFIKEYFKKIVNVD